MTLTHSGAAALLKRARNPYAGKPLENNTRLFKRGDDYAVRLHNTDVVTIHADGTYTLANGGWPTLTTRDRIMNYAPVTHDRLMGKIDNGRVNEEPIWYGRPRPNPNDPRPHVPRVDITKPYSVTHPGKTPDRQPHPCECIVRENDPYGYFTPAGTPETGRMTNPERDYGTFKSPARFATRCTACGEDARRLIRYTDALRSYERMQECIREHGSMEHWMQAYRDATRERRAALKAEREWEARNRVEWTNNSRCRVDSDGYVIRGKREMAA